jgi:hypothetical protein
VERERKRERERKSMRERESMREIGVNDDRWGSIVSRYRKMEGRKECCYALLISCKKL